MPFSPGAPYSEMHPLPSFFHRGELNEASQRLGWHSQPELRRASGRPRGQLGRSLTATGRRGTSLQTLFWLRVFFFFFLQRKRTPRTAHKGLTDQKLPCAGAVGSRRDPIICGSWQSGPNWLAQLRKLGACPLDRGQSRRESLSGSGCELKHAHFPSCTCRCSCQEGGRGQGPGLGAQSGAWAGGKPLSS